MLVMQSSIFEVRIIEMDEYTTVLVNDQYVCQNNENFHPSNNFSLKFIALNLICMACSVLKLSAQCCSAYLITFTG